MFELAELYRQLGDPQSGQLVTVRIQATLEQLSSLEALCQWFLARYAERAHQDGETSDLDLLEESMAAADAEAWARADAMLKTASLIRRHLGSPTPPTRAQPAGS